MFHLDPKSLLNDENDVNFLTNFIREAFESMAMVNYPYPTEFLAPLPGWPVKVRMSVKLFSFYCFVSLKVACQFFNSSEQRSDKQLSEDLYGFINLYYNYTGTKATLCANPRNCEDSAYSALGDPLGWPWQVFFTTL